MSQTQFLFSGFGGQGILFAGKFLAYKGMIQTQTFRQGSAAPLPQHFFLPAHRR